MKKVLLALAVVSCFANADTVRLSDGMSCSSDSDDSNMEMEVYAGRDFQSGNNYYGDTFNNSHDSGSEFGVSLTYKFNTPSRLDCNILYEMELESRKLDLELKRKKLELLENAKDIDW